MYFRTCRISDRRMAMAVSCCFMGVSWSCCLCWQMWFSMAMFIALSVGTMRISVPHCGHFMNRSFAPFLFGSRITFW